MSLIDDIKARLDIVDVVSEYVPDLKKVGHNYRALCPFHSEKQPSFYVFPERQSWHCFGACGTGGDIFSFVMKKEGVDFAQACRLLAQRAGVQLIPKDSKKAEETEKLFLINQAAADYYHHILLHSPAAGKARDYLLQRGVSAEMVELFQLGFSLDSWEALQEFLILRGYPVEELVAAGLLVEKETGGSYDRFRNRLMFPIRDINGKVSGFGARALDDSLPKYLNSPQTTIFDKSNLLYGIDLAKETIKKEASAIIVEGYMDVITAHQYGFKNVVASLGTALTEKQARLLKKLTGNINLALDADTAGEMATLRGIEIVSSAFESIVVPVPTWRGRVKYESSPAVEIKIIVLPRGKDPDEVIKENPQEWTGRVEKALPVVDYLFSSVTAKLDLTDLKDKSAAVDQLLPFIAGVKNPLRQAHYRQKLARLVGVEESTLVSALKRLTSSQLRQTDKAEEPPSSLIPSLSNQDLLEEYCLALLIRYPELSHRARELSLESYFEQSENREILLAWLDSASLTTIKSYLDTVLREHLEELVAKEFPPMNEAERERALTDCASRLRERWLRNLKAKEGMLLSSEEETTDLATLQQSGLEVTAQLKEVFQQSKQAK
jgi:DNA primase